MRLILANWHYLVQLLLLGDREGSPFGISEADGNGLVLQTMTARQDLIAGFGAAFPAKEGNISKNVEKWLENINLEASPYAITESIKALLNLDLRPQLSKISIPVAIFHGTQDKLCSFEFANELNKGIKNSRIIRFENSGHALFVEESKNSIPNLKSLPNSKSLIQHKRDVSRSFTFGKSSKYTLNPIYVI
jgi:pimeloyl-ACP methyl ester carboxylesterase